MIAYAKAFGLDANTFRLYAKARTNAKSGAHLGGVQRRCMGLRDLAANMLGIPFGVRRGRERRLDDAVAGHQMDVVANLHGIILRINCHVGVPPCSQCADTI